MTSPSERRQRPSCARFAAAWSTFKRTSAATLSHELHDEIGQELTGLGYLVERMTRSAGPGVASTSAMAKETVDRLLEKVRDLSMNLRPAMLDDLGLLPTLAWLANRFSTSGVDVDFEYSGLDARFDPEVETCAFRVAQEALTNVARHADSAGAELAVHFQDDAISLTIENASGSDSTPTRYVTTRPRVWRECGRESRSSEVRWKASPAPLEGPGYLLSCPPGPSSTRVSSRRVSLSAGYSGHTRCRGSPLLSQPKTSALSVFSVVDLSLPLS